MIYYEYMNKKLTKSINKKIAGVLGGIAEYFDLDPTIVRVCFIFLFVFSCGIPAIIFYILAALIMPSPYAPNMHARSQQHNQPSQQPEPTVHDVTPDDEPRNPHE